MNFRQTKMHAIRCELKEVGLSMREARQLDNKDQRILYVAGKLLSLYPVSFDLHFIFDHLGISIGSRVVIKNRAFEAYFKGIQKRA